MADGRHLEKSKNGHISATVWPICTKSDTVTPFGLPKSMGSKNYQLLEIPSFYHLLLVCLVTMSADFQ